jgi:hypothetical protein
MIGNHSGETVTQESLGEAQGGARSGALGTKISSVLALKARDKT